MSDVGIAILSGEEARDLRREAEQVFRSVHRLKTCECATPWRGTDGHCGRCGKRATNVMLIHALRQHIEALDEIDAHEFQRRLDVSVRERLADPGLRLAYLDDSYAARPRAFDWGVAA